jgi:glycosidase
MSISAAIAASLCGAAAHGARAAQSEPVKFPPVAAAATASGAQLEARVPPGVRAVRGPHGTWRLSLKLSAQSAGGAKTAQLAGDFTQWQVGALPMERLSDGSFSISVDIPPGVRSYKFILDGSKWIADPANPDGQDDGHGGRNSLLRLGADAALDPSLAKAGDGQIEGAALFHDIRGQRDRQRVQTSWTMRYRTLHGDVQSVQLVWRAGVSAHARDMRLIARQGPYDVWEAPMEVSPGTVAYTFLVKDGPLIVRDPKTYSLDANATTDFRTPDWAKNAVWYQIMVDRFRNGNAANDPSNTLPWTMDWASAAGNEGKDGQTFYRHFVFDRFFGGDLSGLRTKLPYLKELGVNALYLMPMFQATTPHKYNTTSFIHVDEHFGAGNDYAATAAAENLLDPSTWKQSPSDKEFVEFIAEAKRQGFRVIIDGVFNHVGTGHPAFQDVKKQGKSSAFADWFDIKSWDPFTYDAWWGFSELPVLKKDAKDGIASAAARKHIFDVTRRWMDPNGDGDPSDGIDGWRLDVPNEVPAPFWRQWRVLVKQINPNAYISGEIWNRAEEYLAGDMFDAVMNYEFAKPVVEWVGNRAKKITVTELDRRLAEVRLAYPAEAHYALMNLLDSHDTDRVASMMKNPDRPYNQGNRAQDGAAYDQTKPTDTEYAQQRLLALLQMTYVGAPMIYYGDEVGVWGASDPNNRKPMLWQDLKYSGGQEGPDLRMLDYYKRIIALRNQNAALRTGDFRTVLTDDAQDLWAFVRQGDGQQLLVALNASASPATLKLPELSGGGAWKSIWGDAAPGEKGPDGAVVPARAGRIWSRPLPKQ